MIDLMKLTVGQIFGGIAGIIVVLSIFIEITPIKINPVSSFLKWIGKKANEDLKKQVEKLDEKVDGLEMKLEESEAKADKREAITCRVRILRFGDELRIGTPHSKENFDQVLSDIDTYKKFCDGHKDFENEKTVATTEIIKDNYRERISKNDFL